MANIKPVTKSAYAHKYWQRYTSYAFAATDAIVPLVMQELPRAQLTLPIGFSIKDEQAFPVAVQGLQPGTNLLVGADGRWLGAYVPAAYRGYPFVLADTEEGKQVLCIDEDSGLISEADGESFFTSEGNPAKALSDVLGFLQQVHQDRRRTLQLCSVLQKHNLIQPWPIQIKVESEEKRIEGLYRIDEKALNVLEYDAYRDVSKAGALPLAYCQLLSMQHLQNLARLSEARQQQTYEQSGTEVPDVEKIFGETADDDIFSFDF